MKYVISNTQVFETIYNYLEKELRELQYTDGYDYEKEEYTSLLKWFYIPDSDETFFEYVSSDWFIFNATENSKERWLPRSPILEFRESLLYEKLTSMFSNFWHEPFEKWYQDTYPYFPVKTFLFK